MPKPKGATYYAERINAKQQTRKVRKKFKANLRRIERLSKIWQHSRPFDEYNAFFSIILKKDLVKALSKIPRRKGRPLEVFEEGAGKGLFLAELKQRLAEKGVPSHMTALSIHYGKELEELLKAGKIDRAVSVPSEKFLLEKPVDAIFSLFGPLNYSVSELRKDHLLKLAHSLRKNGLMLVGLNFKEEMAVPVNATPAEIGYVWQRNNMAILHGFSENPKNDRRMKIQKEMSGIERALRKRGFDARFYDLSKRRKFIWLLRTGLRLPNIALVIKRVN